MSPEDHDDPDEEEDVEADGGEDGEGQEPVAAPRAHPALLVLAELGGRINSIQ